MLFVRMKKKAFVLVAVLMCAVLFAMPFSSSTANAAPEDKVSAYNSKVASLSRLVKSIDSLYAAIEEKNNLLNNPENRNQEQALKKEITDLHHKLENLEKNFNDLASEVNYDSIINPSKSMEFNWNDELKDIMRPLISELQRATSKPREIEKHRSDIESYNWQLDNINRAEEHIRNLMDDKKVSPSLRKRLSDSLNVWEARRSDVETLKNISNLQLEKINKETESLSQTIQKIPALFFKSHGRNFLLSLIALAFSAYCLFRLHNFITRHSPLHRDKRSFYSRTFDLVYSFLSVLLCLVVILAVYYYCSDWVLLSLAVLFIIGLVWTSKTSLPRIWNQSRLILNLGPVREGELVVYNGIPYQIATINLYTMLFNPAIPSGRIRLPISDLESMRSRPVDKNEPWFPSRVGDWVMTHMDTERVGCVVAQTPETVLIEYTGGATLSFNTSNYLSSPPLNLSSGFRVRLVFGLDYDIQAQVTLDVPDLIKTAVEEGLKQDGFKDELLFVRVDFKQAASSSLDLDISADFKGQAASGYIHIKRTIQKACVDLCTEHGWSIPFNQITVHMPGKN